jgi:glycosyltransferase involved in cell wall biosynthesis
MRVFISKKPEKMGGGSNTFAYNFISWAKKNNHKVVSKIQESEWAILIANYGEISDVKEAKANGCYILHRIDEYFQKNEDEYRRQKHQKIYDLNQYADVTIFQSHFVYLNAYPFLRPKRYKIILNGGDPKVFYPALKAGEYIGHVTWGVGVKQRLDILYQKILNTPEEIFLLVGRHRESGYDFNLSNVILRGSKSWRKMSREYRKMKLLFYPSQNDPCPNAVIEAILSGVPVCYNSENPGGIPEIVKDCGETLEKFDKLLDNLDEYRQRCLERTDLYFENTMKQYLSC